MPEAPTISDVNSDIKKIRTRQKHQHLAFAYSRPPFSMGMLLNPRDCLFSRTPYLQSKIAIATLTLSRGVQGPALVPPIPFVHAPFDHFS